MALVTYTESELQLLVLNQINKIKGLSVLFTSEDASEAYNAAVRDCGFEHPANDDDDLGKKYRWLLQRMRRWYTDTLLFQYSMRFDSQDMKTSQISKSLMTLRDSLDKEFNREINNNPSLFSEALPTMFYDDMVTGHGLVDDQIGQDATDRT